MTGAAVLAAFAQALVAAAPELADFIGAQVQKFVAGHPELGEPPPPDEQAGVDQAIDAKIRAKS